MLFPTLSFAAFFAVVLPVSWLLMPHRVRWRLFMVSVSWLFYGAADWRFVPLLAGSTVVNQFFARRIYRATGAPRKNWTIAAVATNLVVLAWFKYIGFLSLTLQSTLRWLGIHAHLPLPEVLLPIGISFFTFQALSYVIDTSRGKISPVSMLEFAVYLSFFPHLVAGPIVRATEFLPQIKERIDPRHVDVGKAFWLISLGLFKKVVIASYLGTYAADPLFGFPRQHGGVEALFGVYAYAIQIYADFSGYTDIAIGLALLLGIRFPQNFNAPYSAASLQDFWRRWHMTLSRWLRDYLYIPLGGSRRGRARTYLNIMITMLLGGLWHGAAWTFVAWGALHGTGLVVERWRGERRQEPTGADPPAVQPDLGKGGAPPEASAAPPTPAPAPAAPTARRPKVLTLPRGLVITTGQEPAVVDGPNGLASDESSRQKEAVTPLTPAVPAGSSANPATAVRESTRSAPGSRRPWPDRLLASLKRRLPPAAREDQQDPDPDPSAGGEAPSVRTSGSSVADVGAVPSVPGSRSPVADVGAVPSVPGSRSSVADVGVPSAPGSDSSAAGAGSTPAGTVPLPGSTIPGRADAPAALKAGSGAAITAAVRTGSGASTSSSATASGASAGSTSGGASLTTGVRRGTHSGAWPERSPQARLWIGRLITFHVVCLAWIFFRATSFHNAVEVLGRIASIGGHHHPFKWKVAAVVVGSLAVQLGPRGGGARLQALFSRMSFWWQALVLAGVLTAVDLLGPAGVAPFIYFRF